MDRIETVVRQVRRRTLVGRLARAFALTTFGGLLVASVAIAYPALFAIENLDSQRWNTGWIVGSLVVATIAALLHAFWGMPSRRQVAIEIDGRFGLSERMASSLAMPSRDRQSDFGQALLADANAKATGLPISREFKLLPTRVAWLPVAMVPILAIVMLLARPAETTQAASKTLVDPVEVRQVKTVAKALKKRIADQKRVAEEKGLTESKEMFERMEAQLDKLAARKDVDRKQAMIEMNDLKKELEERREQLGSSGEMRKMMSQMNGISSGPGEKVAKAIAKGEFAKAEETVRQLAKKMKQGDLSEKEKQQLQQQTQQMADAMKKAIEKHEQKKQELQRQIDKAKGAGKSGEADKLQQKMNQLQQQDSSMQQMQQMAKSMQQASDAMQQGDASEASEAMKSMADQLGQLQSEMEQLQDLESAMGDLSQGKQQMRCSKCGGGGCQQCQGNGQGNQLGQGNGRGSGKGDRDEAEDETNTYKTQVRGDVKKGRAVIAGYADGPNRKGATREAVKQAIESAISEAADPSENQVLPRTERQHAREYFDRLRDK